ncbi:hypothetical protein GRJ2_001493700 [Grus japonensis]|uniref:Uncharacterized protein n=1 Tax=Grus japonensis TaxID=30415 RepID=A0ABC9WZU2_GRUJA
MERGIQYLRELAMWEMVYYAPDNVQLPTEPDEVQCTQPMWWKFVQNAPSSYANSLAVMDCKGKEAPTVDEVSGPLWQYKESLSSSLVLAVEKLTQKVQQFREAMSYSLPIWTSISAIRSKRSSAQERGYKGYMPRGTLCFYLRDHGEDMRKWDGKPTSTLETQVHEFQEKNATPVSSRQFPRQSRRADLTYNPLEETSNPFLQEVSNEYYDQD